MPVPVIDSFEWSLVRVLEEDGLTFKPPGFKGQAKDQCKCLFCGCKMSAQLGRIRGHVGQVKGFDVAKCTRPKRQGVEDVIETEQAFENRQKQFEAAKLRCVQAIALKK